MYNLLAVFPKKQTKSNDVARVRRRLHFEPLEARQLLAADFDAPSLWVDDYGVADGWQVEQHPRVMADVNNDGRADVVGFGAEGVWVSEARSTGDPDAPLDFAQPRLYLPDFFGANQGWDPDEEIRQVADINGDGRADIVAFDEAGIWSSFSIGSGFGTDPRRFSVPGISRYFTGANGWQVSQHPRMLADVNGDGSADVVGFGTGGVWVALSNLQNGERGPNIFKAPEIWVRDFGVNQGWQTDQHLRMLSDVNGDGRADIVGFGTAGVLVSLSMGDGSTASPYEFSAPELWVRGFGTLQEWQIDRHPRMLADVTGDGRPDVVGFGTAGVFVARSMGDGVSEPYGFGPCELWLADFSYNDGWRTERHVRTMADVNGDGCADIVGFGHIGTFVSLSTTREFQARSLPVEDFGYGQGWRVDQHVRTLADVNRDGVMDIVGFGGPGVWVSLAVGADDRKPPSAIDASWFTTLIDDPAIQGSPADFDGSGEVDLNDFEILRRNFGIEEATRDMGDADGDRDVDIFDFSELSSTFGERGNVRRIDWDGEQVATTDGQWIVQVDPAAARSVQEAADLLASDGIQVVEGLGRPGLVLVRTDAATFGQARQLFESGGVAQIVTEFEPNYVFRTHAFPDDAPNDPSFGLQWGLDQTSDHDIDAPEAWRISTGSPDVIVGVIDSGINYLHSDLTANIWTNPDEIPSNEIDDDGNGLVDDVFGYDFVANDGDPMDKDGHGTHVAGTIAAVGDNNTDVIGVAPDVKLMALRSCSDDNCAYSDAIQAINYATMMSQRGHKLKVLNVSWGGDGPFSGGGADAMRDAAEEGLVIVASAGNGGADGIGDDNDGGGQVPASLNYDNIISVTAMTEGGQLASFSNFGRESVDLAAPGVRILSTTGSAGTEFRAGTSMAAAHVSGVAALAWSAHPSVDYTYIRDAIFLGAEQLDSLHGVVATGGRLNAANTVAVQQDVLVQLPPQFLLPPLTRGDDDFDGHGPKVTFIGELRIGDYGGLETRIFMSAEEWENGQLSDSPTVAAGWSEWETAYVPPYGRRVESILSETESDYEFVDTHHFIDERYPAAGGLVERIVVEGDTDGGEAGTYTSVTAYFNDTRVRLSNPAPPRGEIQQVQPSGLFLVPPHLRGDTDFSAGGPFINVTYQLRIRAATGEIEGRVFMHAAETNSFSPRDFTVASGWSSWEVIYRPEQGRKVAQILSPMQRTVELIDNDHLVDLVSFRVDHRVLLVIVGDTDGDEAGSRTSVEVRFTFLDVVLE